MHCNLSLLHLKTHFRTIRKLGHVSFSIALGRLKTKRLFKSNQNEYYCSRDVHFVLDLRLGFVL